MAATFVATFGKGEAGAAITDGKVGFTTTRQINVGERAVVAIEVQIISGAFYVSQVTLGMFYMIRDETISSQYGTLDVWSLPIGEDIPTGATVDIETSQKSGGFWRGAAGIALAGVDPETPIAQSSTKDGGGGSTTPTSTAITAAAGNIVVSVLGDYGGTANTPTTTGSGFTQQIQLVESPSARFSVTVDTNEVASPGSVQDTWSSSIIARYNALQIEYFADDGVPHPDEEKLGITWPQDFG